VTPAKVGRLQRILVSGLFEPSGEDVDVRLQSDAPTVLTGANGTGKSTLLRLINSAATGDMSALAGAPLQGFRLEFDANPTLIFARDLDADAFSLSWGEYGATFARPDDDTLRLPSWAAGLLEDFEGPTLHMEERLERAGVLAGVSALERRQVIQAVRHGEYLVTSYKTPDWYEEFRATFPVLFVTDQRLVVDDAGTSRHAPRRLDSRRSSRLAVEAASADIAGRMRMVDSQYARVSQIQDRRFVRTVIAAMNRQLNLSKEATQRLVDEVAERREALREVGLLEPEEQAQPEFGLEALENPQVRPVIATFLEATKNKLAVFDELAAKLTAFKRLLDERFYPKGLDLSRRQGLRFTLPSSQVISSSQLSSGEQQMLVLAYEILFRAEPGTLVLIDEPEISLHVRWQATLIEHLLDMGKASHLQFLLATHSPVLIGNHRELEHPLDDDDYED